MENIDSVLFRRMVMSFGGTFLCGVCVAFFRQAALGVDPFSSVPCGLFNLSSSLGYGTIYLILNASLVVFMMIFARKYIGPNTFVNMFLLGNVTEFSEKVLVSFCSLPSIYIRVVYMCIATPLCCLGAAMCITAGLGVSAYDWIALTIADRQKRASFRIIRIFTDVFCVLFGAVCGYRPGAGTVILALGTGPIVAFFRTYLLEPVIMKHN